MKIQCNACETAEANVLCCADEAALCWGCDEKIHAANKLAGKHQRVPLSNSNSQMPKCDICQEMTGYFFCLEDRALFCRKCDVAIHTANSYVSRHQRFLLTGVKVGLEPIEPVVPSAKEKVNSKKRTEETPSKSLSKRGPTMSLSNENNKVFSNQGGGIGVLPVNKVSFSGCTMTGIIPDWPLDEFLGLTDFSQNYGFMEQGSSKADSGKLGDSESSLIYPAADEELDGEECMGQVPEISWMVPEIPSPPTASGLYWPRNFRNPPTDKSAAYVPDIISFSLPTLDRYQPNLANLKRRRQS